MHKVTSMEAHRVLAVLDDTLERLSYLSYLPQDPYGNNTKGLLPALDDEGAAHSAAALTALLEAEAGYGNRGGPETDAAQADRVAHCVREFCRSVRNHPVAAEVIFQREAGAPPTLEFINQLSQLKGVTFRHLSTTIEEETTNRELLHDLDEKVQRAERQRERLQHALDRLRVERDREVSVLDQTLSKLSAEKQDLSQSNRSTLAGIEKEVSEHIEKSTNEQATTRKALEDKLNALRGRLAESSDEHRELENTQRRLMARKERDLSAVIEAYDGDMSERLREIEDIERRMAKERDEFITLDEHFDRVDANMAKKSEEEKIIMDLRKREAQAMSLLADNAIVIQTMLRVRQTRAEFVKAFNKKNKKGKKGKKGKK